MTGKVLARLAPVIIIGALLSGCGSDGEGEDTATTDTTSDTTATGADGGGAETTSEPAEGEGGAEPAEQEHGHEWSYDESAPNGPAHWGDVCESGARQSPIDVTGAEEASDADLPDITFAYQASDGVVADSGHAIQVSHAAGSTVTIRDLDGGADATYELKQFHFHAHSEHTIDGEEMPLEVHFVHQAADGDRVVIGVLVEEGAAHEAYAPVVEAVGDLPAHESAPSEEEDVAGGEAETTTTAAAGTPQAPVATDVSSLLPDDLTYYRYSGSLTTPTPTCEENVEWHVMTEQIEMSAEQIAVFADRYEDGNARPTTREGADDLLDSRG